MVSFVQIGFPVERGRAVIGQQLVRIDLLHGFGERCAPSRQVGLEVSHHRRSACFANDSPRLMQWIEAAAWLEAIEASAVRSPVMNSWSRLSISEV